MKHHLSSLLKCTTLLTAMLALSTTSRAQNTTWANAAGGDWNTAANWNANFVPGTGTNVFMTNLVAAYAVTYSAPMTAPNIATLSLTNSTVAAATLNVNSSGFNVSGNITAKTGSKINVGSGGVITSGSATFLGNGNLVIAAGGFLTNNGTLGIGSSTPGAGAVTNNGATLVTGGVTIGASADGGPLVLSGNNLSSLGNVSIGRCGGSATAMPSTASGVIVNSGAVSMSSLVLGAANSWGNLTVSDGVVTNSGDFILARQASASRGARLTQTGGLLVSTTPLGVRLLVNNASQIASYSILGGTNIVEGLVLGDSTVATGTVNFTNAGTIAVGSGGINNSNSGASTLNVSLNNGGTFYASADWSSTVPMLLAASSTFTFNAADLAGVSHDITLSGALRGTGTLRKIGAGTVTLGGTNINSGSTLINAGTLALSASASLSNSTPIIVGSTLDVSAVSGGFTLNGAALQKLSGTGSVNGNVTVATGAIVDPGSNALSGTLTFANDLIETGGAINHLDASSDKIVVTGLFNVTGTNTFEVTGSVAPGSAYALLQYGSFNGDTTNFIVTGASGTLSNDVVNKTLYLVVAASIRAATNVTWVGNASINDWDTLTHTNWLNNGALDSFVSSDNVLFDATGAANPLVNVPGSVAPGSVTVDATANYTLQGTGAINGGGGLTKNNSGTLTLLTTNSYTGITTLSGGVLDAALLANGGAASAIGAANSDPSTLVISNATLRYNGASTSTDRGATLGGTATLDVANTLTASGVLTGTGGLTTVGAGTVILSSPNSYGGATTLSNGTLQVNTDVTAVRNTVVFAGGTLRMNVSGQPSYGNPLNVTNTGTIISAGGNNNLVTGAWSGSGTLNLSLGSGTFTINGNMTPNFTGTLLLTDASTGTLRFNGGGNASGPQQSTGSATASFDLGNSTVTLLNRNGGAAANGVYNLGSLAGGATTFLKGAANGGGAINASFYSIGAKNLDSTFAGTVANGTGGSGATTSLIKVGIGKFTLTGNNSYTGSTTVSNGILALAFNGATDGAIDSSATITINAGTFLDVSARSDTTLPLASGQTLKGNGTLLGSLNVASGGTVAPGESIGTLTVTNAITLAGTALMEINRAASPNADKLVSSLSTVTYGGTLQVVNVGAALQVGDTFDLFDGAGLNAGTFATLVLPNYTTWNTSNLGVNGTISVTGFLPGPTISSIANDGFNVTINASNGAANGAYTLLTSTNLTAPISSWTVVTTGNFDGAGALSSLSVAVDPATTEQYYLLQVQ